MNTFGEFKDVGAQNFRRMPVQRMRCILRCLRRQHTATALAASLSQARRHMGSLCEPDRGASASLLHGQQVPADLTTATYS